MSAEKQIPTADEPSSSGEASLFSLGHCRAFWTTAMRGDPVVGPAAVGNWAAQRRCSSQIKRAADFSAARRHSQNCLSL